MLVVLVPILLLFSNENGWAEMIAMARTWAWHLHVESSGEAWDEKCRLVLVARNDKRYDVSLKRPGVNCALYGPVHLLGAETQDRKTTYVFIEAARGGDGDHSGPIVEVYELGSNGFRKLGEQELFETSYHRKGQGIASITGKVVFSLCNTCDGPLAAEPEDNVYVPVSLTIGCGGLCVKPAIAGQEGGAIMQHFETRARSAPVRYGADREYLEYVGYLRKSLRDLLAR